MNQSQSPRVRFELSAPIFRVEDMEASLRYYVNVLGFQNASWGDRNFTHITHGGAGIYLCRGDQGRGAAWAWIGVEDAEKLFEEYKSSGAKIRMAPKYHSWAVEIQVEDPDGNVLRLGSEPK